MVCTILTSFLELEVKVLHGTETLVVTFNHWIGVGADSAKAC
jgi:hypothetical protein